MFGAQLNHRRTQSAATMKSDGTTLFDGMDEDWDMDMDLEYDDEEPDESICSNMDISSKSSSSIYRTIIENGRRYQTLRPGEYWGPVDDKQFESMERGHLVHLALDCQAPNPLFRSPVGEDVRHILDIGTGEANWVIDVADRFPGATVRGVDLFPAPSRWMPPNCFIEVDDVLKPWIWTEKFDLVHLRWMLGSFTPEEWATVYKQAYDNLNPGGWIEQIESDIVNASDDNTIPPDSKQAGWGPLFHRIGARIGKPLDTVTTMRSTISDAGFVNIHERLYRVPLGPWPKHPMMKEIGRMHLEQVLTGLEGYATFLLTRWGDPEPWTPERTSAYLAEMKEELLDPRRHAYTVMRRVWAQKPESLESLTAKLDIGAEPAAQT